MAFKITKLDFELEHNEKIPNGLWYVVADYVKKGGDSCPNSICAKLVQFWNA